MKRLSLIVGLAVALVLHILFGWMWGVAGSLVSGFISDKRPGTNGALTLMGAWGVLIGWNMAIAPAENMNMMDTMANLLGGMPGFVIPVATLLVADLLGLVAGSLGASIKPKRAA
jgi:hypothetical protein